MKLHEEIAATREAMIERGHAKMVFEDETGKVCIRGAYALAITGDAMNFFLAGYDNTFDTFDIFDNFLAKFARERGYWNSSRPTGSEHVSFNNAEETTETEVLEFLHEAEIAAKELESTGG